VISDMPRMDNRDGTGAWESEGNPYVYHTMTHHGEDAGKLRWFTQSDILYMQEWAYFLDKLKSVREGEGTLPGQLHGRLGATGGSVNAHNNHHLPAILCGGKGLRRPAPRTSCRRRRVPGQRVANDVPRHETSPCQSD